MHTAHPATLAAHAQTACELNFDDTRDFDDARRGFIGTLEDAHIEADAGGVAWTMRQIGRAPGGERV